MELDAPTPGEEFECPHCGEVSEYRPRAGLVVARAPDAPVPEHPPRLHPIIESPHRKPSRSDPRAEPEADPVRDSPPPTLDRAALAGLPPANGPEVDVMKVHPSVARSSPILWASVWLLGIVGVLGLIWLLARQRPAWMLLFPGTACVGAAATLLAWKLRCMSSEVRITTKRIIDRDGLFSRRVTEVLHRDIKRIDMRQTMWQRLCGVGELSICADAEDGPEVYMAQLPNPARVREVLDVYRNL